MRLPSTAVAFLIVTAAAAAGCAPGDATVGSPCGIAPLVFDSRGDVVQGESADGADCARIERRAVELEEGFMCKACPYDPLRLVASVGERFVDVTHGADGAELTYEPSHHNWADIVSGGGARVELDYLSADDEWVLVVSLDGGEPVTLPTLPKR